MNPGALIERLADAGLNVALANEGRDLSIDPPELVTKEYSDLVRANKSAVIEYLINPAPVSDWPEIQPLPDQCPPIPDIDPELIPYPFRAWLERECKEICVPSAGLVAGALVALATVVGRGAKIYPERYGTWEVTPNLWGAVVAPPGLMKSAILSAAFSPIDPLVEVARDRYLTETDNMKSRLMVLESKLGKEKRQNNPSVDEIRIIQEEIADCEIIEKRYVINDATIEKLQIIQAQNPQGVTYIRDELAGWLANLSKQGREGDRSYFLEAWDGSKSSRIDRVGRDDEVVKHNCLSLFGTIQPSRLAPLVSGVDDGTSDDGLLQRLQVLVYVDRLPDFSPPGPHDGEAPKTRVLEIFNILDGLLDHNKPRELRFDIQAQEVFDLWRSGLEARFRGDEFARCPSMGSHLAKYRSLMPTLAGLFHLVDEVDTMLDGASRPISPDGVTRISESSAQMAVRWTDYLETHAARLYGTDVDIGVAPAWAMAERIKRGQIATGMTERDIKRSHWTGLDTDYLVESSLAKLEELGWLSVSTVPTGGRPKTTITINPSLKVG